MALAAYVCERYSSDCHHSLQDVASYRRSRGQIHKLLQYIHDNLDKDLSLTELSAPLDLSPNYFCELLLETFGISPHQYVIRERIELAKQMLNNQEIGIAEIANRLGFATQSHFTSVLRRLTGTTPRRFRLR